MTARADTYDLVILLFIYFSFFIFFTRGHAY